MFRGSPKTIRVSRSSTSLPKGVRHFGVSLKNIRRTRSHRMKFCVQTGLEGAALHRLYCYGERGIK